ncbi:MAG: MFS transporter, partial [Chloroflexi bacterium]|nr:MFS transporter [Chloroflexota bacterium]
MADQSTQTNWRRNLYVVWLAEVLAIMGFDAAMPFLPYYVQELGITGTGQVELWTGLLYTANAVALGIMGPIWGSLSDRMGRKVMLARAMFGGALFLGAMGFVHNVYQLLVLR